MKWFDALRFLFAGAVLFQSAIVLGCFALDYANAEAGFMRYRLPQFVFWSYLSVGIGTPAIALATLLALWARRSALWNATNSTNKGSLRLLIFWCVVNVFAFPAWFFFGGIVFFGAGGNR